MSDCRWCRDTRTEPSSKPCSRCTTKPTIADIVEQIRGIDYRDISDGANAFADAVAHSWPMPVLRGEFWKALATAFHAGQLFAASQQTEKGTGEK